MLRELERRFDVLDIRPDPSGGEPGRALRRYLAGDLAALEEVSVDTAGTPFQESVWSSLRRIPVGRTVSYAELAKAIGRPTAVRAVAGANGRNPVSIVVPCHRVIATDGRLGGYGGGLPRKRWLLAHEGAI
jgi:methylated-DNA-[protein]-cysteine S-methyltransferase